jgi:hypothetical protein
MRTSLDNNEVNMGFMPLAYPLLVTRNQRKHGWLVEAALMASVYLNNC